jgi:hypothetical protein
MEPSAFSATRAFGGARVVAFSGHYGCGKTEVAVNVALGLAGEGRPVTIVDFDIVNPYFRTADARPALEARGVRVVASRYAGTNVDVPAIPAEVNALFEAGAGMAVFDVGGDDVGAKAVSRFRDQFAAAGAAHVFVMNAMRPMTRDQEGLTQYFHEVQDAARLPYTAVANNTHFMERTEAGDLLAGLEAAAVFAARVGLPLAFTTLMRPPAGAAAYERRAGELGVPVLRLEKHVRMGYAP